MELIAIVMNEKIQIERKKGKCRNKSSQAATELNKKSYEINKKSLK